jgi:hypothetical protein
MGEEALLIQGLFRETDQQRRVIAELNAEIRSLKQDLKDARDAYEELEAEHAYCED